jgi:hypothetical protein
VPLPDVTPFGYFGRDHARRYALPAGKGLFDVILQVDWAA